MLYYGLHWSEKLRVAPTIVLTDEEESELSRLARSKRTSVRLAQRAQIVLLAAQGLQNKDIAEQLGIGRVQVARWRERYLQLGLQGIERDLPRGATVLVITYEDETYFDKTADDIFRIPRASDALTPILSVIPCQLFAYYCAIQRGLDPDKPRNLAKSVTVE